VASSHDALTKILVEKAIDGHACRGGDTFDRFVRDKGFSGAIVEECRKQNDGFGSDTPSDPYKLVRQLFAQWKRHCAAEPVRAAVMKTNAIRCSYRYP
jgi:hypothetical protein